MGTNTQLPPMPHKTREIFRAVYTFRQKWQNATRDPEFWRACAAEMGAISAQFGGDPFCDDLLIACYVDIERVMKGGRVP